LAGFVPLAGFAADLAALVPALADLAGDFFTAWRELLERDLTMDHHSIEPGNASIFTTG
jgi:hypothetical protein